VTEIRVYSCTGQLIWGLRDPGCSSFILSDESSIAVGIAGAEGLPESTLLFFGTSGAQVGSAKVDNFSSGRFSEDGEFFFAISNGKGLIKFTTSGKEVFRYSDCNRYSVSRDGELVAIYKDSLLNIYREQTLLTAREIPELAIRDVRFSFDNRFAAILLTQRLQLLELDSTRLVWEYSLPDSGYQFFHFDSDSSFTYFACSTNNSTDAPERRNTRGQALLIDANGKPVWQTDLSYAEWSVKYPEVKIDLPARILTLLTAERFRIYSF
jgi:outer membrane protein assembly factor BamB